MAAPFILPLRTCTDRTLAGGKAAGLARLLAAGFPVPPGICVTTEAYRLHLSETGYSLEERWRVVKVATRGERAAILAECRSLICDIDLSQLAAACVTQVTQLDATFNGRWAVRSSATNEDGAPVSFAGLYRTHLALALSDLAAAIKDLWASVWEERVVEYVLTKQITAECPAMAVIVQPMVAAVAAGVAFSVHPLTGRSNRVAVNAVPGLAMPLVEGRATPDEYTVEMNEAGHPVQIVERLIADKSEQLLLTGDGLQNAAVPLSKQGQSCLTDDQVLSLARLAKQVEKVFQNPVDLEWAIEGNTLWLLQARPVTAVHASPDLTDDDCEWSRANFKETMPEVPSPLGLSFLEYFMEAYIVAHYRRLGCRIPEGLSSVRTLHGRPFINVTLFHSLVGQLGGDPSLNVEHMGGEPLRKEPSFTKPGRLGLVRVGWLMWRELERVTRSAPGWFAEMKQLASSYHRERIRDLSLDELAGHLDELGRWLDRREITFGIAAGVGQCLQTFNRLLPEWLGPEWRRLLNAALQGQGSVISAQQILRLAEVVHIARQDNDLTDILRKGMDLAGLRRSMPRSAFLTAFDHYLDDYGHRGVGESDIMSPRMSEQPDVLLDVIRVQLRGPASDLSHVLDRQRSTRTDALETIRARCGWRLDRWWAFLWWYRRLSRFFALREANRHHLMYYSLAARNLLLRFGERLVERGILDSRDDVFFLTLDERVAVVSDRTRDWNGSITRRRADRERWLRMMVPDTIRDWKSIEDSGAAAAAPSDGSLPRGIPISAGRATGPARLVRSMADWNKVKTGDIIVAPIIDPGIAPLFGIAAGIVAEMGGTLSHGAIIAREYGLPAVANVPGIMNAVKDGERLTLDAASGEVTLAIRPNLTP